MAGDCFTLRAGVRVVVLPFRRCLFVPEIADVPEVIVSALRSTGDAVVPVPLNCACASMAGDVKGLKKSSPSP